MHLDEDDFGPNCMCLYCTAFGWHDSIPEFAKYWSIEQVYAYINCQFFPNSKGWVSQ
jgi:hypothetical protein